jgi:hypothetical protein
MNLARYGFVLVSVAGMASVLHADARSDLERIKSDIGSTRSRHDATKRMLEDHTDRSVKLRSLDGKELASLIDQICRLDIEEDRDPPREVADRMKDDASRRVKDSYDSTIESGSKVFHEIGQLESEAKSARSRLKDLENSDQKDEAAKVREEVDKLDDAIKRLYEKLENERRMTERVKDGVMLGTNNPLIRARLEYGKEMHKKLQSDRSCDEKEILLTSGKPDCIKFDPGACKVIEFKPDTYSTGKAVEQADGYIKDVTERFRNDERARKCTWEKGLPVFTAVGELYTACRAP